MQTCEDKDDMAKCLLSKKLSIGRTPSDTNQKELMFQTMTPDTPPFTGMKRVFGTSDFKEQVLSGG